MTRRRGLLAAAIAGVLIVAVAVGGVLAWQLNQRAKQREAAAALAAYGAAYQARDMSKAPLADPGAATSFKDTFAALGTTPVSVKPGPVTVDGSAATGSLAVTWEMSSAQPWSYDVPVTLNETDGKWLVATGGQASPWQPQLANGEVVTMKRVPAPRGDLLDRNGQALMPEGKVYDVQLDPTRATENEARALAPIVEEDPTKLVDALTKAQQSGSKAPIPVITYREADFLRVRSQMEPLIGVIYPPRTQPLAESRTFGQPILGSVGPATADAIKASDGRVAAGDQVGLSGLQAQYDEQLAGSPGVTLVGNKGAELFTSEPTAGTDIKTTLDPDIQRSAEDTLANASVGPSAIVAIDVPTGEVLALASSPTGGFNRAVEGRYAPGSTFKVATTYGYLTNGIVTADTPVSCPTEFTVDGRAYRNYQGESIGGSPPFSQDFINSCNTAFVSLSSKLGPTDLTESAKALGIGAGWEKTIGIDKAFGGSVPTEDGATARAEASIGQGKVEVSPLALGVMAGSIARGAYIPPVLVHTDANANPTKAPLDAKAATTIQDLMGKVVTSGTGTAANNTPGGAVHGKTGTAEFGSDDPPKTRAWFTGYQGNVAFAVLVDEGRSGGTVAAPLAKTFLTALAQ